MYVIKLLFILVTALALFITTGCTQKAEEGKTKIHFVTWKPNIPEAWEEILQIFSTEHPDIELVREIGPHS